VDVEDDKLKLARNLGATAILRADHPDVVGQITEMTRGQGADLAVEAVGVAPAVQTAIGSLRKGGRLVLVGNVSPKVELPLQAVVTRELSLYGSCASAGEYPECMEMIAAKKIRTDVLLSAVAPLSEGGAWFHRLHAKEKGLMKVLLSP
jgi:L-iditol 2-dehydrogenase